MPCVELGSTGVILNQPYSTLLVYSLGLLWIWAALRFWKSRHGHKSRAWWALSLLLGGLAAISAGTSYQAFGYELKCAGRDLCVWTNGWEIGYLLLQVASMNAMLVAIAYACSAGRWRTGLLYYAAANWCAHALVTVAGVLLTNRFMISYELLVLFTTPTILMYFFINGWRYYRWRLTMDKVLLASWSFLSLTNLVYFIYLSGAYTQRLWLHGIWFSENDVLHILVVAWVLYVGLVVVKHTNDTLGAPHQTLFPRPSGSTTDSISGAW